MVLKNHKLWPILAIILLMILAFAVRFYNHHDWLYFKMDQSRDALLTSYALENGPGYLPLLGPRAGATEVQSGFLRLGPAFYYFQYIAGKIFHSSSPDVLAYPDLFFSIAVLPLLYALFRLYFSRPISLLSVFLYSFSFIIIEYSRFSWNPNSLPFFVVLTFFGLLKFFRETQNKKKKWWLALWAIGLAIGSQLHFFGFFCLIGISGLMFFTHYELWQKAKIIESMRVASLKKIIFFTGIFIITAGIIYTPFIISDAMRKGENSKNFIQALTSKPKKKSLDKKIIRDFRYSGQYYCLITTASCVQKDISQKKIPVAFASFIIISGLVISGWQIRKTKDKNKKDFLWLAIVWTVVFFILSIPVSYQLRPRFFIVVFPVPFMLLGILCEFLWQKFNRFGLAAIALLTAMVFFLNIRGTLAWFDEQSKSQKESTAITRTLILKNKDGVTLGQLQRSADYIYNKRKPSSLVYYYVKPEHVMPIKYLLYQKNDASYKFTTFKKLDDSSAQYFAIVPSHSGEKTIRNKFGNNLEILSREDFGQLSVFEIKFTGENQVSPDSFRFNREGASTDRLFWKDVFGTKEVQNNLTPIDSHE
jgi:4-amino-4-deoxy-L-arabinose transferase-like glycosyltransferase